MPIGSYTASDLPPRPTQPIRVGRADLSSMTVSVVASAADLADPGLIGLASTDDARGIGVLYDRHGAVAYGLALRITGDPKLAEDAVKDAFLSIWRNAQSYGASRGGVRTGILIIVHNRSIDALRKRRPVAELPGGGVDFGDRTQT